MGYSPWGHKESDTTLHACTSNHQRDVEKSQRGEQLMQAAGVRESSPEKAPVGWD